MTVESLQKDKQLVSAIKDLVRSSGRSCPPSQGGDEPQAVKPGKEAVKQQPADAGKKNSGTNVKAAAAAAVKA